MEINREGDFMINKTIIIISFLIAFNYSQYAKAGNEYKEMLLLRECEKYLENNCRQQSSFLKNLIQQCEINYQVHNCDGFKNDPDYIGKIKSCQPKEFCRDITRSPLENGWSCLKGVGVEKGWNLLLTGYQAITNYSWEKAEDDLIRIQEGAKNTAKKIPDELSKVFEKIKMTSASELSDATKKSLEKAWLASQEIAQNTYDGYFCLNTQGMSEFRCKVLPPPTRAIKIVNSTTVSAAEIESSIYAEKRSSDEAKSSRSTTKIDTSRTQFTKAYLHYHPTTEEQNLRWMVLADKSIDGKEKTTFFDVENSVMKKMNDTIKDKDFVTSLTNKQKEILFDKMDALMKQLKKNYPDAKMYAYSDFKASRFAIQGVPEEILQKELSSIFQKSNQEFVDYVKNNKFARSEDKPENWFRSGIGNSADQASLANRRAREMESNVTLNYSSPEVQNYMNQALRDANVSREKISRQLQNTAIYNPKTKTLDPDAFDILRKYGSDTESARKILVRHFALEKLDIATVTEMQNYMQNVDAMMPAIHVAKREVASLAGAEKGGLSADIVGLGAKNYEATAKAMSDSTDLESTIKKIRIEERLVTTEINKQKIFYQDVVNDVLGKDRVKNICTGDDCISISSEQLTQNEKQMIMDRVSNSEYSGKFRKSFISDNIRNSEHRTEMATQGESLEKTLRKYLVDKIEPRKLQGITFGIDMRGAEVGRGLVDLIVGKNSNIKLSSQEQIEIQRGFRKAVESLNQEQIVKNKTGRYFSY